MGFVQIREDLCLLILVIDSVIVAIIALYVDDILIGTDTDAREQWLLLSLQARFFASSGYRPVIGDHNEEVV